jgi:SAM-dependent methyltransferase
MTLPTVMDAWLRGLEQRHFADLTFSEVTRALRALSSTYVERRERLAHHSAFDSAGKRAAYALYYGPLHFLTVSLILDALTAAVRPARHILDLGCGGGAAGAAWASRLAPPAQVTGVDSHPWALTEAAATYRVFGLRADTRRGHAARIAVPRTADAVVAGWVLNELDEASRAAVKALLLEAARAGKQVLVVEPIATRASPWWGDWVRDFLSIGGRADEWRFAVELPDLLERFDRAAGLRHDRLKARSLFAGGRVSDDPLDS